MRTGAYGAICVIIAVTVSILGGYLLNAETVDTCETEFTYVTNIAGAFEGSTGDVEMDYNPAANVTGWSTSSTFNNGYMSGVNFKSAAPNSYFIYGEGSGPSATVTDTITIQLLTENGVDRWQAISANDGVIVDDLDCNNKRLVEPNAVSPSSQLHLVHFFDLADVMAGYSYTDYETITLGMPIAYSSEWPGITFNSNLKYHYQTSNHPGYYEWIGEPVEEAVVYGASAVLAIGESSGPIANAKVGFIGSFTFNVSAITAAEVTYVDPSSGVRLEGSSSAYWNNNQRNVSTQIVFSGTDLEGDSLEFGQSEMDFHSENHNGVIMLKQVSNVWTIQLLVYDPDSAALVVSEQRSLGKWPGMSLTIEGDGIVARPVSSFADFGSYTVVDAPITIEWNLLGGEDLLWFGLYFDPNFNPDESLRLQVVTTKVRLVEGGLYLQDGAMTVLQSFPGVKAFKLTLGSAAHVGDSVTVSGTGGSVTVPATANGRFVVDGKEIEFGQCSLMWVSSSMETEIIHSVSYPAALYQRGESYSAGTVWMSTPSGIVELGAVGENPTVTLDGLWAPAVHWYTGENAASSHTEVSDITDGVFKWDKNQFVLILMGTAIVMGLAGSYFGYTRLVDWTIIIGAVAFGWVIL